MPQSLTLTLHSSQDGKVEITLPPELADRDVIVKIEPVEVQETDANGRPIGYFERLDTIPADDVMERPDQGDFPERESIE